MKNTMKMVYLVSLTALVSISTASAGQISDDLGSRVRQLNAQGQIVVAPGCGTFMTVRNEAKQGLKDVRALEDQGLTDEAMSVAHNTAKMMHECSNIAYEDARFMISKRGQNIGYRYGATTSMIER